MIIIRDTVAAYLGDGSLDSHGMNPGDGGISSVL